MVRATLTMKVQSGREEEFESAWREVAAATAKAPGNVRQTLLRSGQAASTFIITSDWATTEDFGRFERSPEQDDLTAPLRALRESASMQVDEVVAHIDAG
jgi:heme-degrading monooxygenase HmoA